MRYRRCESGDRNRGRVGRDDRFGTHQCIDPLQEIQLDVVILGHHLDHDIGGRHVLERGRSVDRSECSLLIRLGHFALGDQFLKIAPDPVEAFLDRRIADLDQGHAEAGYSGHLSDAASHRSSPDHGDRVYCHLLTPLLAPSAAVLPVPKPARHLADAVPASTRRNGSWAALTCIKRGRRCTRCRGSKHEYAPRGAASVIAYSRIRLRCTPCPRNSAR